MKKIIFGIALVAITSVFGWGNAFCDGYVAGYKAGYCHGQNFCMEPMAPMCPMARMGETTYQDGYNRGFLVGLNAK